MLSAKEALKMTNVVLKDKEEKTIKRILEESAMDLEYEVVFDPDEYVDLKNTLTELGCKYVLQDGKVMTCLYDYDFEKSFMADLVAKVNSYKESIESNVEKCIQSAIKFGKREITVGMRSCDRSERETIYIQNTLNTAGYHTEYDQEGDMIISW